MFYFENDSDLVRYIESNSSEESELLKELGRETHLKILHPRMLSGHMQGRILSMLSHMIKPEFILEIGTFTGYSAICLAEGLQEYGKLITIEVNEELESFTRSFLKRSLNANKIDFRIGNSLEILDELQMEFDLVFIDGDKREYLDYYKKVIEKTRKGGYIIVDNILWSGKVVEEIQANDKHTQGIVEFNTFVQNDPRVENVIFPIRDGLMIIRKI